MNKLKFYKEGTRYYHFYHTVDDQFLIGRDEFTKGIMGKWRIYKRKEPIATVKEYETITDRYFSHYVDAMAWICEYYYPGWKLQKKLVKLK